MTVSAGQALRAGLASLQLELSDAQISKLLDYQLLIAKWNKVYNLTAVRDPAEMLTHHLLDSLAAVAPLASYLKSRGLGHAAQLLDVGSGAGLPGIVFAICCPHLRVTCVDAVGKKAAFITQSSLALDLPNLTGLHARVETIEKRFDVVSSRAFASLGDFTQLSRHALAPAGAWLAMKGKHPVDELAALAPEIEVFHVEQLVVPGLDAERCLLWMRARSQYLP